MRSFTATLLWTFALISIAGAAQAADTVRYEGRFAAKFPEAAKLNQIAVLAFTGPDGGNFSAALAAELQSAVLDGQQVFSVKTMEGLTGDGKAPTTKPGVEVAAAIRSGNKLGAQAVYIGEVTSAKISRANRTEQRSYCAEPDGFLKCKRQATRNVSCTRIVVDYAVAPRAINVSTGAIVYSQTIVDQGSYDICDGQTQAVNQNLGDTFRGLGQQLRSLAGPSSNSQGDAPQQPAVMTEDALVSQVRNRVAEKVRRQVAPYNQIVNVTFKRKAPELPKGDQERFKSAGEFGDIGRLDRACGIWESIAASPAAANSVSLLYNLGVCQEALLPDDPNAALEYYAKADQLLSKPDKLVSDAYVRTKRMVDAQRSIQKR
ncbi:hypothetical protein [Caulobacter endophyticus]|uniref:hypothetical protein n=1 Tax=Caulobacter endophyticus TaxID=2172652 RepID=UPI002410B382|nr:hypothetical protein [Caulobacter endophyticus]MDG2528924.1 hypothetical protein [Caulobacter endophyticus]